jgi:hypothetical protein
MISAGGQKPQNVLVVSCSDHRLSASSDDPWYRGLLGGASVYEVRVPGGALGLLSEGSSFANAVLDSVRIFLPLPLDLVVLSCHEDCAYYRMTYTPSDQSSRAEVEHHRLLLSQSRMVVARAFPNLNIYDQLISVNPDSEYGITVLGYGRDTTSQPMSRNPYLACEPVQSEKAQKKTNWFDMSALAAKLPPNALEQEVYDHILRQSDDNAAISNAPGYEDLMSELRSNSKIERHAREFMEIMRSELGVKSKDKLKNMTARFLLSYGRKKMHRQKLSSIVDRLDA